MKKVFTTGQIARICKVAPRTVSKWFDSGRLQGYRIPGSQDRRVPRDKLRLFLTQHGMPTADLDEEEAFGILLIAIDAALAERLRAGLSDERIVWLSAETCFDAGLEMESLPKAVIIDLAIGRSDGIHIVERLRREPRYDGMLIVALLGEDESAPGEVRHFVCEAFRKPFDPELLVCLLQRNLEEDFDA